VAIPLLAFALAGQRITERVKAFRQRATLLRRGGGLVLLAVVLAIAFDLTTRAPDGAARVHRRAPEQHRGKGEGISAWLNTPDGQALTLGALRGKVVLVDFWTYSCINCQRTLPHVEAWDKTYRPEGLVVVGVHTPEFAFEHVVSNISHAAGELGAVTPSASTTGSRPSTTRSRRGAPTTTSSGQPST
jgi:thiol-disulfide isomerase/thioredoxin